MLNQAKGSTIPKAILIALPASLSTIALRYLFDRGLDCGQAGGECETIRAFLGDSQAMKAHDYDVD